MPIHLTYPAVRAFARNLRELVGHPVRHGAVLEDIAAAIGQRPDAMMHRLKSRSRRGDAVWEKPILRLDSRVMRTISRRLEERSTRIGEPRIVGFDDVVGAVPFMQEKLALDILRKALECDTVFVVDLPGHPVLDDGQESTPPHDSAGTTLGRAILDNGAYEAYYVPAMGERPSSFWYKGMRDVEVPDGLSLAEAMMFIHRAQTFQDSVDRTELMEAILDENVPDRSNLRAFYAYAPGVEGIHGLRCQWYPSRNLLRARCLRSAV